MKNYQIEVAISRGSFPRITKFEFQTESYGKALRVLTAIAIASEAEGFNTDQAPVWIHETGKDKPQKSILSEFLI